VIDRRPGAPSWFVGAVGAVLLLTAAIHHSRELLALSGPVGSLLAPVLDGVPALGLVYAGYRLHGTDPGPPERWRVGVWSVTGTVLSLGMIGATLLVRAIEGRPLAGPAFPLLIAAGTGGLAGFVAGYYDARARTEAERTRRANDARTTRWRPSTNSSATT